jgi:hypothetical protein
MRQSELLRRESRQTAVLCRCACIVLLSTCLAPGLLHAEPPDARALGITDAVLHYCEKAYPPAMTRIKQKLHEVVQHSSEEEVAAVRKTPLYHKAYDSMNGFVAAVHPRNAERVCTGPAAKLKR